MSIAHRALLLAIGLCMGGQALGQCVPPVITEHPQGVVWCLGAPSSRFNVTAVGSEPFAYQWRRNGVNIHGAIERTYFDPRPGVLGSIDCVVSNACGSAASELAPYSASPCVSDTWSCNEVNCGCGAGPSIDDLSLYLGAYSDGVVEADCDDGSFTGTRDSGVTVEDLIYWLFRFSEGC